MIAEIIDGRRVMRGHGRQHAVWGRRFDREVSYGRLETSRPRPHHAAVEYLR
jgi:hypothetical protein